MQRLSEKRNDESVCSFLTNNNWSTDITSLLECLTILSILEKGGSNLKKLTVRFSSFGSRVLRTQKNIGKHFPIDRYIGRKLKIILFNDSIK